MRRNTLLIDADDTLWHTEHLYSDAQEKFSQLLAGYTVPAHEVVPGGDDSRWVRANIGHVGEEDRVGVTTQCDPKHLDLVHRLHNEHGFTRLYAVVDERNSAGDKLRPAGIHEGLVPEFLRRLRGHAHCLAPQLQMYRFRISDHPVTFMTVCSRSGSP